MNEAEILEYNMCQLQKMDNDYQRSAWLNIERFRDFWIRLNAQDFRRNWMSRKKAGELVSNK